MARLVATVILGCSLFMYWLVTASLLLVPFASDSRILSGGKGDEDINVHNEHTTTKLRMVSLYNFMLESFKYKGHCVVMDSAYMGDAMCQVGQEEWKINMVGTVQSSRTSGGRLGKAAIKDKEIEKGTHKLLLYQHNTKPLVFAVWADNNFVMTLSNFHSLDFRTDDEQSLMFDR
jgi:hypothetical protein